ncbi:MAG: zinc ABC transporter substrate-binding protein [Myxococcales bacterium]|nr:zinc ABC transporter substrate-binding protein [Myxococcales bacterium]
MCGCFAAVAGSGCKSSSGSSHAGSGSAASSSSSSSSRGKLRVVTTTGMIADMARRLAGDAAAVESLMATGVDPHLYKASEGDVRKLVGADLVLYNGLHLEGKMSDVLHKMKRGRPVIAVADAIPKRELREAPGFGGTYDPHIWFDVSLWAKTLPAIASALSKLRPARAAEITARRKTLEGELVTLDAWVKKRIAAIPAAQRVLVTAHDAFGYFGRRYGLEVVGLQGISTVAQAGLRDVDRVAMRIVKDKIKAIFVESSVPKRTIRAVQAACKARGHDVRVGGELYSDSMGAPGTRDGTYPGMVRHNVETIVKALAGGEG